MIDNSIGKRIAHAEIKLLLDYSHQLYQKYLESNKKFIYASVLRKVNARLYERLHDSVAHLKDETHSDALKFMIHLDVWMTIWDFEYEKKSHSYGMLLHFIIISTFQNLAWKIYFWIWQTSVNEWLDSQKKVTSNFREGFLSLTYTKVTHNY